MTTYQKALFLGFLALILAAGTSSRAAAPTTPLKVSTDWLAARLDDPSVVVVHVGFDPASPEAKGRPTFEDGHVPFARPMEWAEVAVEDRGLANEFPPAARMTSSVRRLGLDEGTLAVVYDTGWGLEASRAFVALEYLGLRVAVLDGHWKAWVREGRDVSRAYMPFDGTTEYLPRLRPGLRASREEVRDRAWLSMEAGGGEALLDARTPVEYFGWSPGRGVRLAGHIPGARNLPWDAAIVSRGDPSYRPEEELRALFEYKGVRPGLRVTTYCRSGVQAAHLYVTARLLGYEASLYDGSWLEWSAEADAAVEGALTVGPFSRLAR